MPDLVQVSPHGLYCPVGDFYIDPWHPVDRAVITHAHADHARQGCGHYLTTEEGKHVLQTRMGVEASLGTLRYGEKQIVNGVSVSLHPAGHILGSAQVRLQHSGEVWVISGDYKTTPDRTCQTFEPVKCDTFVTECTFGLPIYRWQPQEEVFSDLNAWWQCNRDAGIVSVVFAYALGKAQRVLAGLDRTIAPVYCHGAVQRVNADYRSTGVDLPDTTYAGRGSEKRDWQGALVLAPPSALGNPWMNKFGAASTAFASGWMQIRGTRRRRNVQRGFALSDHADWSGLIAAIRETGASRVLATHGRTAPMVRWLQEHGYDASALNTEYVGESDDAEVDQHELGTNEAGEE